MDATSINLALRKQIAEARYTAEFGVRPPWADAPQAPPQGMSTDALLKAEPHTLSPEQRMRQEMLKAAAGGNGNA